jgi:anti-anti-sigma factor
MENLSMTATDKGTHVLMVATGRITGVDDGEQLASAFDGQLSAGRRHFVLDLAGVDYMNSTGLNLLLRMFTKVRNSGGDLLLGGMNSKVSQLLVITKLNSVLKVSASTAEAEAHFSGN